MAKLDKLITYAYLREETDIPQNIEDAEFEKKIYRAQEMLRMLIGDEFYRDFLSNYRANTLSAAYNSLYDPYMKQFIAWQTYEFWVKQANFKPTRSGFRVHTEENSTAATDAQMGGIIKDANQTAQYYKVLMVDFLEGHYADYSLYDTNCNNKLLGNGFHISAVRKKHHDNCKCHYCR
jgi:hypothetical protein